jgi:hypothetical protein
MVRGARVVGRFDRSRTWGVDISHPMGSFDRSRPGPVEFAHPMGTPTPSLKEAE